MTDRLVTPPSPNGSRLIVEFFWMQDRFAHRVLLASGEPARLWLASLEGDAGSNWLPSPPLQQLSIETQATGEVALLLGMAGRSHWSLSVEALPGELRFDAACRVKDEPQSLGSCYRLCDPEAPATITAEANSACEQGEMGPIILPAPRDGDVVRWSYRVKSSD